MQEILGIDIFQSEKNQVEHKLYFVGILYKIYMMRTKACREDMLSKLLRAYSGSMHPVDQVLLKVIKKMAGKKSNGGRYFIYMNELDMVWQMWGIFGENLGNNLKRDNLQVCDKFSLNKKCFCVGG